MLIFNSIVYGAFVGALMDYWLGRAAVKDNLRLIISVMTAVIVGLLVFIGEVAYFA